jgi:hypothetical protein
MEMRASPSRASSSLEPFNTAREAPEEEEMTSSKTSHGACALLAALSLVGCDDDPQTATSASATGASTTTSGPGGSGGSGGSGAGGAGGAGGGDERQQQSNHDLRAASCAARCVFHGAHITPYASMASATFTNPPTFAPFT